MPDNYVITKQHHYVYDSGAAESASYDQCDVCGAMCTCTPDENQVDDAVFRAIGWAANNGHDEAEVDEKVLIWLRANIHRLFEE